MPKNLGIKAGTSFSIRAVDPHSFVADPDQAVFLNADPDPAAFEMRICIQLYNFEKKYFVMKSFLYWEKLKILL